MSRQPPPPLLWSLALGLIVLAALVIGRGCGFVDDLSESIVWHDTAKPGIDASTAADTSIDTRSSKDVSLGDTAAEDAYTLPPDSITTCGEFFDCIHNCPEEIESCSGACYDAMTPTAAGDVQSLASCINSSGCHSEGCMLDWCGPLLDACFNNAPY